MNSRFPLIFVMCTLFLVTGCDKLPNQQQIDQVKEQAQSAVDTAQDTMQNLEEPALSLKDKAVDLYENRAEIQSTVEAGANIAAQQASAIATRINEDDGATLEQLKSMGTPAVSLGTRMQSMWPDQYGNVTIRITEAELTSALVWDTPADEQGLKNTRASIGDGVIVINANVQEPIQSVATITIEPTIVDGKLQLTTKTAKVGHLPLPKFMIDTAANRLSNSLLIPLKLIPGEVVFDQLSAVGGELTLYGYQQK